MTRIRRHALCAALVACCCGGYACADELAPVYATNLTPFTAILGQPVLRSAVLPSSRRHEFSVEMALASHSGIGRRAQERAFLDGETLRVTFEYRRRLAEGWQLALLAPWIEHRGGFLDSVIDRWHALTGLSNGQRDVQGRDRLRFEVAGPNGAYRLDRPVSGAGDARIELLRSLPVWRGAPLALRAAVELPTGDAERLTGNGATDFSLDLLARRDGEWRGRALAWHAQLGLLVPGRGDVLPGQRRGVLPLAAVGATWAWRARTAVFAQITLLRGPWHSDVEELGHYVAEVTVGARFAGGWHMAISEDLRIDRSPDFVARVGWATAAR